MMQTKISRRKQIQVLAGALLGTACVSTSLDPGRDHPANAKAETAPSSPSENILASAPAEPKTPPAPHAHDHAAPMADTYTCPMHPQVIKNAPGKCPICGMNLVKKEGASPEGAAH